MFKLYTGASLGGFAPHAVLEEAGAEYELVPVDPDEGEAKTEDFVRMNPRAEVPVLVLPDGAVMTESSAMLIYLADLLAPGDLAPLPDDPSRPQFLRWVSFLVANVYAGCRRYYYPDRHTADPDGIEAVRQSALAYLGTQLGIIDEALGKSDYLAGARYSAADIYLTMLAHWHPQSDSLFARCPHVARVCAEVRARSALERINRFHRLWQAGDDASPPTPQTWQPA